MDLKKIKRLIKDLILEGYTKEELFLAFESLYEEGEINKLEFSKTKKYINKEKEIKKNEEN